MSMADETDYELYGVIDKGRHAFGSSGYGCQP